jgi:ribonuclease P protein component
LCLRYQGNSLGVGVKGRRLILELLKKGFVYESRCFKVYCLRNSEGKNCITAAVPKKTGTAVERNRLRRIIKEGFRKELFLPVDFFVKVKSKDVVFSDVLAETKKIKETISDKGIVDPDHKSL